MQNGDSAIEVRDLHKSFGSQTVLDGIDMNVKGGEIVAVLGRSGTGKSVLLKLIIGLQKPDSGSILLRGQEITQLRSDQLNSNRKKVGFLFQQAALYDSLTVEENVAFPIRRLDKGLSPAQVREKVSQLLSQVGMEGELRKLPSQISGGMQKRVGLARALALDPEVLLCDEPTSGLDPITAAEINELIVKLQSERKMAAVVVTHDLIQARKIATRLALLYHGKFVFKGSFDELSGSQHPFVVQFLQEGGGESVCQELSA